MPKHKCAATMAPTITHQTRDLAELAEAFHTPPKAQEGLSQRRPRREACAAQDHRGDQDDAGRRRWAPPPAAARVSQAAAMVRALELP
jgi:hypothetical protein